MEGAESEVGLVHLEHISGVVYLLQPAAGNAVRF